MPLSFRHLISSNTITKDDLLTILKTAEEMDGVLNKGGDDRLKGHILATLFYEPSTRTRLSFETAMLRLGGEVVTAEGFQFSSLYKGESIEDNTRVIMQYADIIAMRHPSAGSAAQAANVSAVPFINAGDGPNEHPTQGLLDVFTVWRECGRQENLTIAFVGDLKFGRTARSCATLLSLLPNMRFIFVSPDALKQSPETLSLLRERGAVCEETDDINRALDCDVIYMTRIQKERFDDIAEYERLKDSYILTAQHLKGKAAKVMHPLPRVNEIATDIDALPNAAYFRQVHNGVPVRMALLTLLLGKA